LGFVHGCLAATRENLRRVPQPSVFLRVRILTVFSCSSYYRSL
jgi:hypothetical protein